MTDPSPREIESLPVHGCSRCCWPPRKPPVNAVDGCKHQTRIAGRHQHRIWAGRALPPEGWSTASWLRQLEMAPTTRSIRQPSWSTILLNILVDLVLESTILVVKLWLLGKSHYIKQWQLESRSQQSPFAVRVHPHLATHQHHMLPSQLTGRRPTGCPSHLMTSLVTDLWKAIE